MARSFRDSPPSYDEVCGLHSGETDDTELAVESAAGKSALNVNSIPYSKLEYSERDESAKAPDIYLDRRIASNIDAEDDDVPITSDKDGVTYCYSFLKIHNEKSLLQRFSQAFCSSNSACRKSQNCMILDLKTQVVFRYRLCTKCNDLLLRQDHFIDYSDDEVPEHILLTVTAKKVLQETESKLSPICESKLCNDKIRHNAKALLRSHRRQFPPGDIHPRIEVQTVEMFTVQIALCKYKNTEFTFYSLGEEGKLYIPTRHKRKINFLTRMSHHVAGS